MKYAYFTGCVTPQRENPYELSARQVLKKLGVELVEMKGASCCGFFLDAINHLGGTVLAAKNIILAEEMDLDILTLCPTCSGYLTKTKTELIENKTFGKEAKQILEKINKNFKGTSEIKHIMRVLAEDIGLKKIKNTIIKPLNKLKVVTHYGCHLLKPSEEIKFDDPEDPSKVDDLLRITQVKLLDYPERRLCCGAPVMGVNQKLALDIVRNKLISMKNTEADAIITVCPFCHLHYDLNQIRLEREYSERYDLPVLHYTQLLGLAQGIDPDELGFYENRVSVDKILNLLD
jgi:heterodisulfide reductase subunit B